MRLPQYLLAGIHHHFTHGCVLCAEQVMLLGGGAEEQAALMEAQAAKEKEERVELLRRQIGRRMMNSSLTRGWSAWMELWQAKVYAMARLKQAGKRLRRPELGEAFELWIEVVTDHKANEAMTTYKQKAESLAADRDRLIAEVWIHMHAIGAWHSPAAPLPHFAHRQPAASMVHF